MHITLTDTVWRKHEAILSTIELFSTEPADDVNDPAGFLPFHFFTPYMQHCYGNMYLMLYSLHLNTVYLVWFYSSFWSIGSLYKLFWMPFLKAYTPQDEIESSTAYPHLIYFFPRTGFVSGYSNHLGEPTAPHWTLSDAQLLSVYHWTKHVNSTPRTAYALCLATLHKKVCLSLHTCGLIKPIIKP